MDTVIHTTMSIYRDTMIHTTMSIYRDTTIHTTMSIYTQPAVPSEGHTIYLLKAYQYHPVNKGYIHTKVCPFRETHATTDLPTPKQT